MHFPLNNPLATHAGESQHAVMQRRGPKTAGTASPTRKLVARKL